MWSAYLFQTSSGNIGPRLDFESVSWSIELNGVESISMKLKKSTLPNVNLNLWLSPWWAGVVLLWDKTPVVAGPIITRPSESSDSVSIGCGGIRSVLAKRFVTREQENWDNLNKDYIHWSGLSLGTIGQRVVSQVMQKPSGQLPISFALPEETVLHDADHERTYRSFNIQNINAHDVLTKLSNVLEGPDIMFKPRLLRDNQLTFDMWHGTERQPRIYQDRIPVWDTTAGLTEVGDMSTVLTGSYMTSRVYSLGAGQDEGTLIKVNTNEAPLQMQYPLLETAINVGNSENPVIVNNYGVGTLWANKEPLLEVQLTVRGDGDIPFGKFWPGDLVKVVTKGWLSLPDGVTEMRLLSMTGDSGNSVKISLQKEEKFA